MADEPDTIHAGRGDAVTALSREDLDIYGVAELDERAAQLRAEIARTERCAGRKRAERDAAHALFGGSSASTGGAAS